MFHIHAARATRAAAAPRPYTLGTRRRARPCRVAMSPTAAGPGRKGRQQIQHGQRAHRRRCPLRRQIARIICYCAQENFDACLADAATITTTSQYPAHITRSAGGLEPETGDFSSDPSLRWVSEVEPRTPADMSVIFAFAR